MLTRNYKATPVTPTASYTYVSRLRNPDGSPRSSTSSRSASSMTGPGGLTLQLKPVKSPGGNAFAFANWVSIAPLDAARLQSQNAVQQDTFHILLNDVFVFRVKVQTNNCPGEIGLTDPQRSWMGVSLGPAADRICTRAYDPLGGGTAYLNKMIIEIDFASRNKRSEELYDQDALASFMLQNFDQQILAPGEILLMDTMNIPLRLTVKTVELGEWAFPDTRPQTSQSRPSSHPRSRGLLFSQTHTDFYRNVGSGIKLKASASRQPTNTIIAPDFSFEKLGIGGLDQEFSHIFRRAFASRIFPPDVIERFNAQKHVRGLLLFGPPGTGKTLTARKIGQMLNTREPKVINGPEVLNKYVGQSEENVRKLFADAEQEYKEKGDESGLHIIIFDELDAVCKQRGSSSGGTGVGDSVVNQLLSKLDGVHQLNNILLIGMTNRIDMIDEALLRPGRLKVHVEIGLPDEAGRLRILNIKTAVIRENGVMASDVDLDEVARRTKNFSGAEIDGLCNAVRAHVFGRYIEVDTMATLKDNLSDARITMADFEHALTEVTPAFGRDDNDLEMAFSQGFIHFSPTIDGIFKIGRESTSLLSQPHASPVTSLLLHGSRGSGATALAAKIAMDSGAPLIKIVSPHKMVGFSESRRIAYIEKAFSDAYKSRASVVVLDSVERLISWVPIGPRFSTTVLDTILACLTKPPPKNRKLLVIATTAKASVLRELDLMFDKQVEVPNARTAREVKRVLTEYGKWNQKEAKHAVSLFAPGCRSDDLIIDIGVKNLLTVV